MPGDTLYLRVFPQGYIKALSSNRAQSVTTAKCIHRDSMSQAPLAKKKKSKLISQTHKVMLTTMLIVSLRCLIALNLSLTL